MLGFSLCFRAAFLFLWAAITESPRVKALGTQGDLVLSGDQLGAGRRSSLPKRVLCPARKDVVLSGDFGETLSSRIEIFFVRGQVFEIFFCSWPVFEIPSLEALRSSCTRSCDFVVWLRSCSAGDTSSAWTLRPSLELLWAGDISTARGSVSRGSPALFLFSPFFSFFSPAVFFRVFFFLSPAAFEFVRSIADTPCVVAIVGRCRASLYLCTMSFLLRATHTPPCIHFVHFVFARCVFFPTRGLRQFFSLRRANQNKRKYVGLVDT